jgi:hypothetical protein
MYDNSICCVGAHPHDFSLQIIYEALLSVIKRLRHFLLCILPPNSSATRHTLYVAELYVLNLSTYEITLSTRNLSGEIIGGVKASIFTFLSASESAALGSHTDYTCGPFQASNPLENNHPRQVVTMRIVYGVCSRQNTVVWNLLLRRGSWVTCLYCLIEYLNLT